MNLRRLFTVVLPVCIVLSSWAGAQEAGPESKLGLKPPVVIKSHRQAGLLRTGDMNSDGLVDFMTAVNSRGLLQIYTQERQGDVLTYNKREEVLENNVSDMALIDWDGDGRTDVLLTTTEQVLGVRLQEDNGVLASFDKLLDDARYMVVEDIDGDGDRDLLAGDAAQMAIFYGPWGKGNNEPQVLFVASAPLGRPFLADVDANGTLDIVYPSGQRRSDVMVRLQEAPRKWALESGFEIDPLAAMVTFPGVDDKSPANIITINARTNELRSYVLEVEKDETALFDGPWYLALDPQVQSGQETLCLVDINDDGRDDLVAASPRAAEMTVFLQQKDGRFVTQTDISLSDVSRLAAIRTAKRPVLLSLSGREETIGASQWSKNDHLNVPRMLNIDHKPLAIASADIDQSGKDDGLYLALRDNADTGNRELVLGVVSDPQGQDALDGQPKLVTLRGEAKSQPTDMLAGDMNGDDRIDLVVFYAYQPVALFVQQEDGGFQELDTSQGLLKGIFNRVRPGHVAFLDIDHDDKTEILVAQNNFVRAYVLQADESMQLVQQFNGRDVSSRIEGIVQARIDGKKESVVLLDSANQILTVYTPEGKTEWQDARHYDLDGQRAEVMLAADFNGDGREDVVLSGDGKIRLLTASDQTRKLQTKWRRSPEEDGAKYVRLDSVELLSSGRPTMLALEGTQHILEMYESAANGPERFFHFKVFDDEQSISRSRDIRNSPQPREFLAVDIDGDGLRDLLALTHDNILYYKRYER